MKFADICWNSSEEGVGGFSVTHVRTGNVSNGTFSFIFDHTAYNTDSALNTGKVVSTDFFCLHLICCPIAVISAIFDCCHHPFVLKHL